jgi:hypothetical protein
MALAAYYRRAAVAAAQILDGFDEQRFADALEAPVGVSFGLDATGRVEGIALLDLTVRLLARLYPVIELRAALGAEEHRQKLERLALSINPDIEFAVAEVGIVVGEEAAAFPESIYAGSSAWDSLVSTDTQQPIGETPNVLGAGASACLAAANLFRAVVLPSESRDLDKTVRYSTFHLDRADGKIEAPELGRVVLESAALVGVGAIGNAAIWALARSDVSGQLHLIDPEKVELSNLQRYVLTTLDDVGRVKVELGAEAIGTAFRAIPHAMPFAEFVAHHGNAFERIAVGVDNRGDRIAVQASLPRIAFNAWTQPGDLGLSVHPHFGRTGACINCLYLSDGTRPNDDELVAQALGVPERFREIRTLLATGAPPPPELLDAVAQALGVLPELVHAYADRKIHDLYSEGICGGAVIPIGAAGRPTQDVHVPVAHQSAFAGVLLAASLLRNVAGYGPDDTHVSRLDVLRQVGFELARPMPRVEGRRCICTDSDFVRVYGQKWNTASS